MAGETKQRRRGRGEGTIYQRGSSWCVQIQLNSGKRITKSFPTRREAQLWAAEAIKAQADGLLTNAGKMTVGQYLQRWLEDVVRSTVKPSTYASYAWLVRKHIEPMLGKLKLTDLRPDQLQALYAAKSASGLTPRTVRYIHGVLHRSLNQAVQWGLLPRNVADVARPPRNKRKTMQTLEPGQVRRLLKAVQEDPLYPLFLMAISTGMRRGEILGLHWKEVDLNNGTIRVVYGLQRIDGQGLVLTEPKSEKSRRAIAMTPMLIAALRQHRARQIEHRLAAGAAWNDQDFVFTSSIGTPMDPRNLLTRFKQILEQLDLPDIRFHDLRHTAATLLLAHGTHPKIVQEMLGHSSIALTLDTYSHVLPDMQREAALQMEAMLNDEKDKAARG